MASVLLSLSIFLRLLVLPIAPTQYANAVLYYLNYYILSFAGSIAFTLVFLPQVPRIKWQRRKLKIAFLASLVVCLIIIEFSLIVLGVPDYFSTISLVPVASALYVVLYRPKTYYLSKSCWATRRLRTP